MQNEKQQSGLSKAWVRAASLIWWSWQVAAVYGIVQVNAHLNGTPLLEKLWVGLKAYLYWG